MFIWKLILKVFKIFASDDKPWQLGLGFALGLYFGLGTTFSWYNLLPLLLVLFINVSVGATFLGLLISKPLGLLAAPLTSILGEWLLTNPDLYDFWSMFFNLPLISLMALNQTYKLGSFVAATILLLPAFFAFSVFMKYYQKNLREKIVESKWFKAAGKSKFLFYIMKVFSFLF